MKVSTEFQSNRASVEWADRELESGLAVMGSQEADSVMSRLTLVDSGVRNGEIYAATIALNGTLTVEVGDENSDLRSHISRILRQVGYQVITAKNGQEGFEVAKLHRPDLIVTDLMMPMVSGIDLIRQIRNSEDLKGTPIILVTARADETTRLEGAQEGADGYLSKPFNDEDWLA